MYSDRPASEVLASVAVSAGQAQNAIPMAKTKKEVVLPSHHGVMVSMQFASHVELYVPRFTSRELLSLTMFPLKQ